MIIINFASERASGVPERDFDCQTKSCYPDGIEFC
jgi:hypothetical protein